MSIAACLLLYSVAVAVLGPRPLLRLTRDGVAPQLGVLAWLAAIASVVASWGVAAAFLLDELARNWDHPGRIASACLMVLRDVAVGRSGVLLQFGMLALTTAATAALAVLGYRLGWSLLRARAQTHQHAQAARLVGRRINGLDAVVLDAPERAAYCVAGRPNTIVVTTSALDVLDDHHLGAVLAHERAHLAGRHHQILAFTRALAANLPRLALFTTGAAEVARLVEMRADDAAARSHGPRTMLGALLALSGATAEIPRGALGATGVIVVARAERLLTPAASGHRWRVRIALSLMVLLVAGGPLFTGILAARGLAFCNIQTS